jgi:hypothetical protein
MTNLTTEEKIDYIYEALKAQKKRETLSRIMKRIWRLAIIGYFIYFYFFWWKILVNELSNITNNILSENMKQAVQTKFWNSTWTWNKIDINSLLNKENLEKVKKYLNKDENTAY